MKIQTVKTLLAAVVLSVALAACAQTGASSASFHQNAVAIGGGR